MKLLLTLLFVLTSGILSDNYVEELPDSHALMRDLSGYDKLYVKYHHCAWSDLEDADGDDNACGVNQDDERWYLGLTECYRAEAAYSIYGVRKGEEDVGCHKSTFVNSFFTTTGVEYFSESLVYAGVPMTEYDEEITSQCAVENEGDDDNAAGYQNNNAEIYGSSTSKGLGCSDTGTFVVKTYKGAYCTRNNAIRTTDKLQQFNKEIEQADCVAIYDGSYVADEDNGNDDGNNEKDFEYAVELLLSNSRACSVREFPDQCPDPHGRLSNVARQQEHAAALEENKTKERVKTAFSWILLVLGILFLLTAAWAWYQRRNSMKSSGDGSGKKRKRGLFGSKNNKGYTEGRSSAKKPKWQFWRRQERGGEVTA
jgi:hypothetical protein